MTRDEAIAYGKEQLEIFGGTHQEFIRMAIEALENECMNVQCADQCADMHNILPKD